VVLGALETTKWRFLAPLYPLVGPQNRAVSIYQTVSLGSSVNKEQVASGVYRNS
jgi:hypothetical protein